MEEEKCGKKRDVGEWRRWMWEEEGCRTKEEVGGKEMWEEDGCATWEKLLIMFKTWNNKPRLFCHFF